ncbi:hypothetical protein M0D21_13970 [Aquimarina sp. D1M17]|uniref:hypothetical protein n=1 Tax=Aquimarina acroporae TaxID=2937283 RepID=UPI0020C0D192|nr:hypothetical protein [Aquimarina acroporae]MCK8522687.1 hypothetical protein [Aquimarina acroporae]
MKKKKLDNLSLKKNVISRLGGLSVKGGVFNSLVKCVSQDVKCDTASAALPCFSKDCIVQTNECGQTEVNCLSLDVACQ